MNDLFPSLAPPNVSYFSLPGDKDIKATKEELDYVQSILKCEFPEENQDAWYLLDRDVDWHQDGEGACFVYCAEGSGILITDKYEKVLKQYQCCVFNDRNRHMFKILSPVTKIFVTNVRGKISRDITESKNFVKASS